MCKAALSTLRSPHSTPFGSSFLGSRAGSWLAPKENPSHCSSFIREGGEEMTLRRVWLLKHTFSYEEPEKQATKSQAGAGWGMVGSVRMF
jgi:hypothetical protein